MAGADTFVEDKEQPASAAATFVEDPAEEQPGFFTRAGRSIKAGAKAVGNVASDVGAHVAEGFRHPIESLIHPIAFLKSSPIADPAKRRQFERGVDDVVTLGYGQRLAARVGNALGDKPEVALGPETFGSAGPGQAFAGPGAPVPNTQEADAAAAPDYRTVGQLTGSVLPGAGGAIAKGTGKVVAGVAKKIAPAAAAAISKIGSIPLAGSVLAPVVAGTAGAARSIAGYEASAPLTAALSAGAEGRRGEAAQEAATDPLGLVLSGTLGGVPAAAGRAGKQIAKYVAQAPKKADEWVINDIRGHYQGHSTPTAREYLAADEGDVVATLKRDPGLGKTLADARHGDRAKLAKASEAIKDKIDDVNAPRSALYGKVDEAFNGGIRSGAFVDDLQAVANEMRSGGTPGGHKMANWIDKRIEELKTSSAWGGNEHTFHPEKTVEGGALDGMKSGEAVALLERQRAAAPAATHSVIDGEINRIRDAASTHGYNPAKRVPAKIARAFVSDVQDEAYDGLGGLASTRSAGQSREIAGETLRIFNRYLDAAAEANPATAEAVEKIRDINTQHSALKNIERVVDQRLKKAVLNAQGSDAPMSLKKLARDVLHKSPALLAFEAAHTGHPVVAGAILAVAAAPAIKRAADLMAAKAAGSPGYETAVRNLAKIARSGIKARDFVQQAVSAGLPVADARRIADAAGAP